MKKVAFALAVVTTTAIASHTRVQAQPSQDHLHCYRINDPHDFRARVDLDALQFGPDQDCRVRVKATLFCRPVEKTVTEPDPQGPPLREVPGQLLEDDRLCYRIRCRREQLPGVAVLDQFGERTIEFSRRERGRQRLRRQLLCTPAVKVTTTTTVPPVTTTTTTTTTTLPPESCTDLLAPECGGVCPPGLVCVNKELGFPPTTGCECIPTTCTPFCFCVTSQSCGTFEDCPPGGNCLPQSGRCHLSSCTSQADCSPETACQSICSEVPSGPGCESF